MKLTLWNPDRSLPSRAIPDFDHLLDSVFHSLSTLPEPASDWSPQTDVTEDEHGFSLKMEVPGFEPEAVQVSFDGGTLVIEGESSGTKSEEGTHAHRLERHSGGFSRSFHLPDEADPENASAEIGNGILEIRIPKKETAKRRLLSVTRR